MLHPNLPLPHINLMRQEKRSLCLRKVKGLVQDTFARLDRSHAQCFCQLRLGRDVRWRADFGRAEFVLVGGTKRRWREEQLAGCGCGVAAGVAENHPCLDAPRPPKGVSVRHFASRSKREQESLIFLFSGRRNTGTARGVALASQGVVGVERQHKPQRKTPSHTP